MSTIQVSPVESDARGFDAMLKQSTLVKRRVSEIVDKFVTGPDSPLDLQPPTDLALIKAPTKTVARVNSTPVDTQETGTVEAKEPAPLHAPENVNVDAEEARFKDIMREYETTAKPKYKTGFDPDGKHSVAELWKVIDDAVDKYKSKDVEGVWGRIRLAFRKLGDKNKAIEGWLGLLPHESHYLSVVCGGLKLVLHAAARMRKVAQMVLDKLAEIPIIYASTRRVLNLFPDAPDLQTQSRALYTAMLTGVGHMIEYLQRKQHRKTIKAFFAQSDFESSLVEKIDDIAARRDALNHEAEMCHKEALNKLREITEANAKTSQTNADALNKEMKALQLVITASEAQREQLEELVKQTNMEIAQLRTTMEAQTAILVRFKNLLEDSRVVMALGWSDLKRLDGPEDIPMLPPSRRPQRRDSVLSSMAARTKRIAPVGTKPRQHRRTLLSRLDYDSAVAARDVETNYRLGSDLPLTAQERSLHVIRSSQLAAWVSATHSCALVINGADPSVAPKSALSFVCARLVYVLDQISAASNTSLVIPLYFFCGQHLRARESWESPAGVANSLIAQLLTQCKDINLSKVSKSIKELDSSSVEDVFRLFKKILTLLPATSIVFCVLDALSFYIDDRDTGSDAKFLASELLKLAGKRVARKGPVLKLLLTAPRRLRVREEDLDHGRVTVLNVPQSLPSTGGFTAEKWAVGVGKQLKKLE